MKFRSQKGEGKLGCIFWLVLALLFGMVCLKVVPVKMATMELENYMEELAMTQPRKKEAFFVKALVRKSEELRLDLTKKNIKVRKYKERVVMDVEFQVPIDLMVYTHTWNVKLHLDRDIFLL